jgi:Rrf2 family nitric oxide-sensitive transcriptional repressor
VQLTLHADYALRVLLYLAERPDHPVSTQEISEAYGISRHHLVRVVQTLAASGFVQVMTGRHGGVALAKNVTAITIGHVVRSTEPSFQIVECFDDKTNCCPIAPVCKLQGILHDALEAFLDVLDRYTLADLIKLPKTQRLSLFFLNEPGPPRQMRSTHTRAS